MRLRSISIYNLIIFLLVYFLQNYSTTLPALVPSPTPAKHVLPITAPPSGYFTVTKVVDGDTLTVSTGIDTEKIRLIGIDTPEVVDPRKPVQCFGKEASSKMKELVGGKNVRLVADPTQGDKDKYDRLLRYVYLPNGIFVNKEMIEEGYAYEYTYDSPYQFQTEFRTAQNDARSSGRGLWGNGICPER